MFIACCNNYLNVAVGVNIVMLLYFVRQYFHVEWNLDLTNLFITKSSIIQQIVTLSKYGHDALNICHP